MKVLMSMLLMVFTLSATSALAVPHKGEHGNKHDYNHHAKKHKVSQHFNKKSISKKQTKSLIRQGWTPPGLHTRYHRGDILERDIYKRAKVLKSNKGTVRIKVDSTIIHLVHDTREILAILRR